MGTPSADLVDLGGSAYVHIYIYIHMHTHIYIYREIRFRPTMVINVRVLTVRLGTTPGPASGVECTGTGPEEDWPLRTGLQLGPLPRAPTSGF